MNKRTKQALDYLSNGMVTPQQMEFIGHVLVELDNTILVDDDPTKLYVTREEIDKLIQDGIKDGLEAEAKSNEDARKEVIDAVNKLPEVKATETGRISGTKENKSNTPKSDK